MSRFRTPESIWLANFGEIKASGVGEKLAEKIVQAKKMIDPDKEWEKMEKENIRMLTIDDSDYPYLLKEMPSPPYIIYTRGSIDFNASPAIAIVGSRKNTSYGSQVAKIFAKNLAKSGITVVSGMALGIDSSAHLGTLEEGGKTIAVLGNGLNDNCIYPRSNFDLSRRIMQNGALVSDYPFGTPASNITFPARNRIIAGLALGTIVVEASEKSGALITAQFALDFNREVFSVPGSIFSPESFGTNTLIKKGAKAASSIKDVLEEFDLGNSINKSPIIPKDPENKNEKILIGILSSSPLHIDNIGKLSKLKTADVSVTLAMMEIKGWIKNIGGQNYILL
jgi:DNA processing protein